MAAPLLIAGALRAYLIPFITGLAVLLGLLLAFLLAQRGVRALQESARARRRRICQPFVDAWFAGADDEAALAALARHCGGRNRHAAAGLLLRPLRAVGGDLIHRCRDAVIQIGMRDAWLREITDRRWWRRAEAAQALGLIAEPEAGPLLVTALTDPHDQVRSAAIDALGRLGDPATLPRLIGLLDDDAYPRARVVTAIRTFGPAAAAALAEHARGSVRDRRTVAEVLGQIGSAAGLDLLLSWIGDADPALRAASLRAIGDIGLDERAYYYALRALGDDNAHVRAMASRAVGRAGRSDAAGSLEERLGDEWEVAAHSAAALKQLGPDGRARLERVARAGGAGADLARQMLWGTR